MRRVIELSASAVLPSEERVLMRVGVPVGASLSSAVGTLLRDAGARIRTLAHPRGVYAPTTAADFTSLFRAAGRNAAETPLDEIVPRAEALALFAGTIGAEVEEEIATLFRESDPALAVILDAYASEMANDVSIALARNFAAELREGARVLPYSPGYCGWHVSGQRTLFATLAPDEIGVTLKESCLMSPLKSVSGVLISGTAGTHRFRPRWTFCDECAGRDCGHRMASVR